MKHLPATCAFAILALGAVATSHAQQQEFEELRRTAGHDPVAAMDLATRLDRTVQQRHIEAMKAAARPYPADLLRWLPPTADQLWVATEPFALDPEFFLDGFTQKPVISYAADHLLSIDRGSFARRFYGQNLRLVAGAARGGSERAYFHFFDKPVQAPSGSAIAGTWMAVPRPNLLVTSNSEPLLQEILRRVAEPLTAAAAAVDRPELAYIPNRQAALWGFGKGVALTFDDTSKAIDLYFLQPPTARQRGYELTGFTEQPAQQQKNVTHMQASAAEGVGLLQMAVQFTGLPLHPGADQYLRPSPPKEPSTTSRPLASLLDQLEPVIRAANWQQAAELTLKLRAAVLAAGERATSKQTAAWNERLLAWLPNGVEAVTGSGVSFAISDSTGALAKFQLLPLLAIASAENGEWTKQLQGATVIAAMTAIRKAPEPTSARPALGIQPFTGCGIYVFAQAVPNSKLPSRPAEDSVLGLPVWTWQRKVEDRVADSSYIALPAPDTIVACNDRSFLQDLLLRATAGTPPQRVALPDSLPQWKHVDKTAPVWGTSVYSGPAVAEASLTGDATGATVELRASTAKIRLFASANPWTDLTSVPPLKDAARVTEIAPGVWELSVEGDSTALSMVPFLALSALQVTIFF